MELGHVGWRTHVDSYDPMAALRGSSQRKIAMDVAIVQASPLGSGVRPPHNSAGKILALRGQGAA